MTLTQTTNTCMQNNSYLIGRNPLMSLRDELYIYFYIHVFLSDQQIDR